VPVKRKTTEKAEGVHMISQNGSGGTGLPGNKDSQVNAGGLMIAIERGGQFTP